MPELRKDPIVDRWVIIAKNRAARPLQLREASAAPAAPEVCPFCPGNEVETPHEIAAVRPSGTKADQPGWQIRVVPNKYPALEGFASGGANTSGNLADGNHSGDALRRPAWGIHEVIIETAEHVSSFGELSAAQLCDVFWMYRARLLDIQRDRRLIHALIFKNVGAAAGASLEHAHSQLMALPMVPAVVAEELSGSLAHYRQHGRCAFCDLVRDELEQAARIVAVTPGFVAFCPFAARTPYETWIVPRRHASHYETVTQDLTSELAALTRDVHRQIESALDRCAYNTIIHTSPFDTPSLDHYHWHIEIIPRVTKSAGFEWGSGFHINPVVPEEAASFLRSRQVL